MSEPTSLERARSIALRYLASRARTEAQVRARLARAELAHLADEVVAWLARLGYLDDGAFALARARALLAPGRLGPRLAERRIETAGIPRARAQEAVRAALDEVSEGAGGEAALCRALAERRARGDPGALDERARARLARFLLGRGFSGAAVAQALGMRGDLVE